MPRVSPIITSFNAGELSPQLYGRVDVGKYANGCRVMQNFIPLVHGPARRRPGTYFIAELKASDKKARLIPFEFSVTQAYVLEFGDRYIRFYKDQGQIVDGGSPYEISSPYAEADLPGLKFVQDADTMYIVHPSHKPRKLTRTGHTAWTLSEITFIDGPYRDENTLEELGGQLCPDGDMEENTGWAGVGTPTVQERSADRAYHGGYSRKFTVDAADEGIKSGTWTSETGAIYRLRFRVFTDQANVKYAIRKGDDSGFVFTESVSSVPKNEWTEYEHYYQETAGGSGAYVQITNATGTSGTWYIDRVEIHKIDTILLTPSAASGSITLSASASLFEAGHVGAYFRLRHGETWGYVQITAVTNATTASATVRKELGGTKATPHWREGAFSTKNGWPAAIAFHEQSLWLAATAADPQTVWRSVVADYENMAPGTNADDGLSYRIASERVNTIRWLSSMGSLIVGTVNGEWRLGPQDADQPVKPENIKITQQSAYGSADIQPINLRNSVLFVQRLGIPSNYGEKVRELSYRFEIDGYVGTDLTLLAEHVTRGGLVAGAFMASPYPIVWAVRSDGVLLGMTYEKDQDVVGWHRHPTAGEVESVCVIPGSWQDELWMVVKRTVNGSVRRYVEILTEFDWGGAAEPQWAFFVDCGLTYDGAPATTISGLEHLAGETVSILADGAVVPNQAVSQSGTVTLPQAASVVHVGLPYVSDLEPMDLEAGAMEGTAQGKKKRIHEVAIKLYETLGGRVGPSESELDEIITRTADDRMGFPPPLFTGDYMVAFRGGFSDYGRIRIRQDRPLPMTVLCLMPRFTTEDR